MVKLKRKCIKKTEFRKTKKPQLPRRSVSNFDQDVFDYTLEDGCVKIANVKSVKKGSPGSRGEREDATKCPQERPACTELLCWSGEGRRGEGRKRLIIVCGAPRPTT